MSKIFKSGFKNTNMETMLLFLKRKKELGKDLGSRDVIFILSLTWFLRFIQLIDKILVFLVSHKFPNAIPGTMRTLLPEDQDPDLSKFESSLTVEAIENKSYFELATIIQDRDAIPQSHTIEKYEYDANIATIIIRELKKDKTTPKLMTLSYAVYDNKHHYYKPTSEKTDILKMQLFLDIRAFEKENEYDNIDYNKINAACLKAAQDEVDEFFNKNNDQRVLGSSFRPTISYVGECQPKANFIGTDLSKFINNKTTPIRIITKEFRIVQSQDEELRIAAAEENFRRSTFML